MGDPVGEPAEFEALLWQFKERADLYGAKIAFYETSDKYLPLYLDLGLVPLKIGEKARIELASFVMTGKKRENQRNARNKFGKLGYSFSLLSEAERQQAMPELRRISDKWLQGKNTREKRFSLGFFDENYIARTRLAVVRSPEGKITAFANLWETDGREEISVDLMRYDEDAPRSIMEFLFVELILAAQAEGFTWFNLGMAPLSGLERRPLAPLWHKIGTVIYDLGEEFYNFDGLYEYKDKFDPAWLPHYVAAPPGPSMPFIMLTIARMIAGGWRGLVFK